MKFLVDQNPEGKCSFTLVNDAEETVLNSILFDDRDRCVAAIRGLTRVLPDAAAYAVVAEGDRFFYEVSADGAAVARSEAFGSAEDAQEGIDLFTEDTSDETQYRVELTTTSSNTAREQMVIPSLGAIDYDSLYDLYYASPKGTNGFETFVRDGKDHYFHFNGADGQALLFSRGFDSGFKRDKRIRQVIAASAKDQRYEIIEKNGSFYFILKERNNQEIARSKSFETRAEAATAMGFVMANAPALAAQFPEPTKRKSVNQYNYNLKATNAEAGFEAIKGDDKANYFILKNAAGAPVLMSQGYSGSGARDNGIRTVIKNGFMPARYERKDEDGKYSFVLRSGNRQEVARSMVFGSAAERDAAIGWIENSVRNYATQYGVIERDATTTTTESFMIDMPPAPALPVAAELAAVGLAVAASKSADHDDYLDCGAYKNHDQSQTGDFVTFKNDTDGQHYFAMLNNDKEVLLRSEGYPDTSARNNGLKSVQTNRDTEERYKIIEEDNLHYVVLRAANNREIARSCPFESKAALFGLFPWLQAGSTGGFPWSAAALGIGALGLAGAASAAPMLAAEAEASAPIAATPLEVPMAAIAPVDAAAVDAAAVGAVAVTAKAKHNDYLDCDTYKKHNDTLRDGFVKFRSNADGLHYFAMLNDKKEVLLRSEGYSDSNARNNGIKTVKDNRDNKDRYQTIEENDQHFVVLKAANRREIARSCPTKDKAALFALFPWLVAGFAGAFPWAAAGAGLVGAGAAATSVGAGAAAVGAASSAGALAGSGAAGGGGAAAGGALAGRGIWGWLPWLLAALLLAALLWWLLKGCAKPAPTGAAAADTTAIVGQSSTLATPVIISDSADRKEPIAAVATALVCDCAAQTDPVFNLNQGLTAKVVRKLGSNPEFGNSHGLTPTQFYDKISKKYGSNGVDKRFLDRIFKVMGYANGFKDANAALFTDVVVPRGTVGNLGYNVLHKTQYSELQPENTEAFRIKAANGCDLHFMKTCGNHFFYCPK